MQIVNSLSKFAKIAIFEGGGDIFSKTKKFLKKIEIIFER